MDYSVEGNLSYEQDGFTCGFGLHRQEKYGDFTDEEMMYIKLARPHLANIVTAICREKSYISGAIERGKEIEMDNAAVWIVNDNFDVETVNAGNNEGIEVNRKNIESTVITICRNLSSKISNEEKANGKEFRDQCRITIGDKSYYIDVRYNASDTDEDTAKYLCMIYDHSNIIDNILIQLKQKYNLSSREFEVLNCLVNGLNNTEISDELCISLSTVKKHTTTIYRKLGIEGRHQLMQIVMWEL